LLYVDPLVVEDDCTNAQGGPIDLEQLNSFMNITGLTPEQLMDEEASILKAKCVDILCTYKYGRSLVNPKSWSSLGTQMYLLNKWFLDACKKH
jgi:hypothetical protein